MILLPSLTKKIQEACPDLYDTTTEFTTWDRKSEMVEVWKSIELQHVLRAIPNKSIAINGAGFFIQDVDGTPLVNLNVCYDLTQPFTNQSEELYNWLDSVLTNPNE